MNRGGWQKGPKRSTRREKKDYRRQRKLLMEAARAKRMDQGERECDKSLVICIICARAFSCRQQIVNESQVTAEYLFLVPYTCVHRVHRTPRTLLTSYTEMPCIPQLHTLRMSLAASFSTTYHKTYLFLLVRAIAPLVSNVK